MERLRVREKSGNQLRKDVSKQLISNNEFNTSFRKAYISSWMVLCG